MPPKIGRNDPCYCGSGKKYKQCHEPTDRAEQDHVRLLRRAQDGLLGKLIEATQTEELVPAVAPALAAYWDDRYGVADMGDLDEKEDRGADRFLTWLAFDARSGEDGSTLVERIARDLPADLELDERQRELLPSWTGVRLRPYLIAEVLKGQGARVRDVLSGAEHTLRDHAAAKRLEQDELIFAHLVPIGDELHIAGAAAQTTADTKEKLDDYLAVHLENWRLNHPGQADDIDAFVRDNSHLFNHFVLSLPREEHEPSKFDDLLLRGRTALAMSKAALGLGPDYSGSEDDEDDEDDGESS